MATSTTVTSIMPAASRVARRNASRCVWSWASRWPRQMLMASTRAAPVARAAVTVWMKDAQRVELPSRAQKLVSTA